MAEDVHGNRLSTTTLFEMPMELHDTKEQRSRTKRWRSRASYLVPASWRRVWHSRFSGWRGGALVSIILCAFVLFVNILLLVIAAAAWHPQDGIATAYTGDCTVAARQLTVAHVFINILSSLLLGASNYCMQRLVAPTRAEIDVAHRKLKALDIGIPSLKNLICIARSRALLWLLLGLSSIPLHFVYNSIIFGTTSANIVTFAYTDSLDTMRSIGRNGWFPASYTNISSAECNNRYSAPLISSYGSGWGVLDTSKNVTVNGRTRTYVNATNHAWSTDIYGVGSFRLNNEYLYCLSEVVRPACQVQLSITLMSIVIVANAIKLLVIFIMIRCLDHQTIVTVGDAIQSFLRDPDPTTQNNCLLSRFNSRDQWQSKGPRSPQCWRQLYGSYWHAACSRRRWLISMLIALSALIPATGIVAMSQLRKGQLRNQEWNTFGRISTQHILDIKLASGEQSIIPAVLLVNSPQVVVSFLYMLYNGLFTCMLTGREWSRYAVKRAMLRVTIPTKSQRSTHFLQLPYTWSVPLLVISTFLHWCISQSVFLVRVAFYQRGKSTIVDFSIMERLWETKIEPDGDFVHIEPVQATTKTLARDGRVFNGIGYSDIALLTSLALVLALTLSCRIIAGCRIYDKGLPIGGTNSAVISAACHVVAADGKEMNDDTDITDSPLKWGVTIKGGPDTVGHLCFSDREVEAPELGYLYAGTGEVSDRKV